jgi:hypothetical protein
VTNPSFPRRICKFRNSVRAERMAKLGDAAFIRDRFNEFTRESKRQNLFAEARMFRSM